MVVVLFTASPDLSQNVLCSCRVGPMQRGRGSPDGRIFSTAESENNQINLIEDPNEGNPRRIIVKNSIVINI